MKNKGQNLIEFIVVIPLLILVFFGIIELSMFWRTAHTVQEMALEAANGAATTYVPENATDNPAVTTAKNVVQNRLGSLGLSGISLGNPKIKSAEYGKDPFALYEIESTQTRVTKYGTYPIITLIVDYRDPYKKGVITQLAYQYRTILVGAQFTIPGGRTVTIIPKDIEISSTKIQQYINY